MVLLVAVAALAFATITSASAAFVGTTTNSGNAFSAAASFPSYPDSVTGNSPWA